MPRCCRTRCGGRCFTSSARHCNACSAIASTWCCMAGGGCAEVSADGVRAAMAIVVFWTIAGLRMAFVSPGNKQGSWVFRIVHGRPPELNTAMLQLQAAKIGVLMSAVIVTLGVCLALYPFAPPELLPRPAMASLLLIAIGMCLLLT